MTFEKREVFDFLRSAVGAAHAAEAARLGLMFCAAAVPVSTGDRLTVSSLTVGGRFTSSLELATGRLRHEWQ